MAETTDLESEQFMSLLTDALRAGPGSPEWHQAVGKLRTSGVKGADEMQLLIRAREDLESGKEYRTVKAGAGFTRNLMTALEDEGQTKGKGIPSANIVALLAGAVILAVVVVVAVVLFKSTPPAAPNKVEQLQSLYFVSALGAVADFEAAGVTEVGPEWKVIGEVPLKMAGKGLRPQGIQAVAEDQREYRAGVLQKAESIPADQAAMVEVTFKTNRPPTDAIIPQVFVSDAPLDEAKGTSSHELVWLLKGGQPQMVKPDMSVPPPLAKLEIKGGGAHTIVVKVRFNKDTVIVETGDKRLYEGPHDLAPTGPRYVGVRFLKKVGDGTDGVWLSSVKVLKP